MHTCVPHNIIKPELWHIFGKKQQPMLGHLLPTQVKKELTEVEAEPICSLAK